MACFIQGFIYDFGLLVHGLVYGLGFLLIAEPPEPGARRKAEVADSEKRTPDAKFQLSDRIPFFSKERILAWWTAEFDFVYRREGWTVQPHDRKPSS